MNFTNTDCVGNCIVFWQEEEPVDGDVCDQVEWKVYVQIKPIKTKIKQDIYK